MSELACVIFDWAGTTVDFGSMSPVAAFREAFARTGVEVTDAEIRAPMGMLKRDHIRTMLAMDSVKQRCELAWGRAPEPSDIDRVYAMFEPALFAVLKSCSALKPGVLEAMQALREAGIRIGSTTGYTRAMMDVVVPCAREQGYTPDCLITPDDTDGYGRPYPYMIFENMRRLRIASVRQCMKVGDTFADIEEGKNAGVFSVAVTEGSSVMGLSAEEFAALTPAQREERHQRATDTFLSYGADFVIRNLSELPEAQAAFNSLYA